MSTPLVNGLRQIRADLLSKLLSKCTYHPDGSMTIPANIVDRWIAFVRAEPNQLPDGEQYFLALESDLLTRFLEIFLFQELLLLEDNCEQSQ